MAMQWKRALIALWITFILVITGVHFVHLRADFPNYSRWMDWAKYTDEGWYANGAIQHFLRGSWYVPGDFNVGAAVPIWPVLVALLFHFTGVSLVALRGLAVTFFSCNLLLTYRLVRESQQRWVALLCVSMIASSSFLFCLSRLATVEPLLIFLMLCSLLMAQRVAGYARTKRYAVAVLLGLLFWLMVLTKTTAIFLFPAILYSLWYPLRREFWSFARVVILMCAVTGVLWSGYFLLLVKPRYLLDYHYFFHVNVYWKPHTLAGWIAVLYHAVHGSLWVDPPLTVLCLLLVLATPFVARTVWQNPLFVSSLLAIGGYTLFVTYINNMQPRYYEVVAFFLFTVISLAAGAVLRTHRWSGIVVLALCVLAIGKSSWESGGFTLYPEYTFVNAARNLTDYIDAHPNGNRLVVSISGNDLSLITGLPSLCDDFGTMELPDKLALYKPGWYAAWNDLDPGSLEDLHTHYSLDQVASYKAFDDDDRDTLNLYRLVPLPAQGPRPADSIIPGTQ